MEEISPLSGCNKLLKPDPTWDPHQSPCPSLMRSSKVEAEQKQVSRMLASVLIKPSNSLWSALCSVGTISSWSPWSTSAPLCVCSVTYRPCSIQRGSEAWPIVVKRYQDLPDGWKSIKQYLWFVTYYRRFIQDKTCFITMVQDGDMCAIMPKNNQQYLLHIIITTTIRNDHLNYKFSSL